MLMRQTIFSHVNDDAVTHGAAVPHTASRAGAPLDLPAELTLRNSPPLPRLRIYGAAAPPRFAGTPAAARKKAAARRRLLFR